MITGEIKSQVDKIWEAFWTGGISNPLTVIEQFTYLLFLKKMDQEQKRLESRALLTGEKLEKPVFTQDEKTLRWSSFIHKDPESMFDLFVKPLVNDQSVFDHMKNSGASVDENGIGNFLRGATFMVPTARLLDQVVQLIDLLDINNKDTSGDLYEYMLSKLSTAGTNGQFRTPRHIIKLMVDMMEPQKGETICDPSSGSAGFLVAASEYYRENHKELFNDKAFNEHFNNKMFTGVEFDSTMLRIGAMNLQLHGIKKPNLIGKDALSEANGDLKEDFSLIFANPPFKGSLDYDAVETSLLKTVKTKKTELLFLGLMLRMLKTGGRCAVIIPDGVLFGSSNAHKQIREEIIANNKLDAVISMPSGVFKPYAGVSTAILIFTKTGTGGTDNVWFYDMKSDGYTLDDKRTETKQNDLPDIVSRYKTVVTLSGVEGQSGVEEQRKRTDQSFLVPFEEIKNNDWDLSINRYKEIVYEEVVYDAPADIISEIEKLDKERTNALETLKGLLG
ncbi:type I restriction-modification system subunit M [Flavobacteriales bacterium]|nr:type I restriction-modification system subunit M [Flavobacteriales bacterium]